MRVLNFTDIEQFYGNNHNPLKQKSMKNIKLNQLKVKSFITRLTGQNNETGPKRYLTGNTQLLKASHRPKVCTEAIECIN